MGGLLASLRRLCNHLFHLFVIFGTAPAGARRALPDAGDQDTAIARLARAVDPDLAHRRKVQVTPLGQRLADSTTATAFGNSGIERQFEQVAKVINAARKEGKGR